MPRHAAFGKIDAGSVGRELYDGAAQVGRINALVSAAGISVIGFFVVLFGVYVVRRSRSELFSMAKTTAASKCAEVQVQTTRNNTVTTGTRLECLTPVAYDTEGAHFERQMETGARRHGAGEEIRVFYQPGDASNATATKTSAWFGFAVIGVSAVVVALAWASWYFARESKAYAAVTGAGSLRAMLR